jgi:uncharacterized protein (DUF433 family)
MSTGVLVNLIPLVIYWRIEHVFRRCVGRPKSTELVSRNQDIVRMISEGHSYQVIGDTFNITRQRVFQIAREYQEDIPDDDYRDAQRTELEGVKEELLRIFRLPGREKTTPGGSVVYRLGENGKPDHSQPFFDPYDKVDIALAIVKLSERISKLYGIDRMRQKEKDSSTEITEALSFLEQQSRQSKILAAQNAALRKQIEDKDIIEAEVVEEETAGQAPAPYS